MKVTFLKLLLPAFTIFNLFAGGANATFVPGDQHIAKVNCALGGSVEEKNASCLGNDGEIRVDAPSGASEYEFSITGYPWQASPTFSGLAPGQYEVSIRDKDQTECSDILQTVVILPYTPLHSAISSEHINCNPGFKGKIEFVNPTGGSGSYAFTVDAAANDWTYDNAIDITIADVYTPVMRDNLFPHCEKSFPAVSIAAPAVLSATVTHTDATCFGANTGSITIHSSSGGTNSFQYSIDGGTSWQGPGDISYTYSNIGKGVYNVQIRDNSINSCIVTLNSNLVVNEPGEITVGVVYTDTINCYGLPEGQIEFVSAAGGSGAYEYAIGNQSNWSASPVFSNLAAQNYRLYIRDANAKACIKELPRVTIAQREPLSAAHASKVNSCFGLQDGEIEFVSPAGGSGDYSFGIDAGSGVVWQSAPNSRFANLQAGSYALFIRDDVYPYCVEEIADALHITEPDDLDADVEFADAICHNTATGYIRIINPTGRSHANNYMYSIDGGSKWFLSGNFSNLASGQNYTVMIRDAFTESCQKTLETSITLSQPDQITADITGADADCHGAPTGIINFQNVRGGSGAYEFSVNDLTWQSDSSFNQVLAGVYPLLIRDSAHPLCKAYINPAYRIDQPGKMQALLSNTNVNCHGDSTGYIEFSNPTGGSGTYSYSITGGQNNDWSTNTQYFNLPAGKYHVMVRDDHCASSLDTNLLITQPGKLNALITKEDVLCHGDTDGSITISQPSGGRGTYQYSYDGGQSWMSPNASLTITQTDLAPGDYDLWIRDANVTTCKVNLDSAFPVTQPDPLMVTKIDSSDITCANATDGSIQFTGPRGGSGQYEFSINNGGDWSEDSLFTDLAPGDYQLVIRDLLANYCVLHVGSIRLSEPDPLQASIETDTITCHEANDGAIRFVNAMSGGWGVWELSIDDGTTWHDYTHTVFTDLAPGDYTVLIRDKDHPHCSAEIASLSLVEPPKPDAEVIYTHIDCYGAANGSVEFSDLSSATIDYEFSVDNGLNWQTNPIFSGLDKGSYTPQMRHANNDHCKVDFDPLTINEPAQISATVTPTHVSCFGASDGLVTIHPLDDSKSYRYHITDDNLNTSESSFNVFDNLKAGTYTIRIADPSASSSCFNTIGTIQITQPDKIVVSVDSNDANCHGASTGSIHLSASGGSNTFEYFVSAFGWTSDPDFLNLPAGAYTVQARDANLHSCESDIMTATILEPADIQYTTNVTDVICNGDYTGKIEIITDPADTRSFSFSKDEGASWQPDGLFENLHAGTYTILTRDNALPSCVKSVTVSIQQPAPIFSDITSSDITCSGSNNGSILIRNISGGTGDYTISINNGQDWSGDSSYYNLAPGDYAVILQDAAGCLTAPESVTIKNADAIIASATPTAATCATKANGQIQLTVQGGSGNYEFSIPGEINWTSSSSLTGLQAGDYQVLVRDAMDHSCEYAITDIEILEPSPIVFQVSVFEANCFGTSDGSISISASGTSNAYVYSINNGQDWFPSFKFDNLPTGTYSVLVAEAADATCQSSAETVTVGQSPDIQVSLLKTDITCSGDADGSVTINLNQPPGDNRTFEYSFDHGPYSETTSTFSGLSAGTYTISVRDVNLPTCEKEQTATINEPNALEGEYAVAHVGCNSQNDGSIIFFNVKGGTGTIYTSIDNASQPTAALEHSNLAAGSYILSLHDDLGCSVLLGNETINEGEHLAGNATRTNVSCPNASDATISVNVMGGSGLYEYSIDGINWTDINPIENLSSGVYTVLARDQSSHACQLNLGSLTISEPAPVSATINHTSPNCAGTLKGNIILTDVTGGSGDYEYSFDDQSTWQDLPAISDLEAGVYKIAIRDAETPGCIVDLGEVTILGSELQIDGVQIIEASCFGSNDASFEVLNPRGGESENYEFSVNGGQSWQASPLFTDLYANEYNLSIRNSDAPQCAKILPKVEVKEREELAAVVYEDPNLCINSHAILIEEAQGGSGAYEYSIDNVNWISEPTFTELGNGPYLVMMRDANAPSCIMQLTQGITFVRPPVTTGYLYSTSASGCLGNADGTVMVMGDGGYGNYQYAISDGESWSEWSTPYFNPTEPHYFNNLSAGIYQVKIKDPQLGCETILDETIEVTHPNPKDPAKITEHLDEQLQFCISEYSVRFGIKAEDAVSYHWFVNGAAIQDGGVYSGSATANLTIQPFSEELDGNIYTVEVRGSCAPYSVSEGVMKVFGQVTPLTSDPRESCPGRDLAPISVRGYGSATILHWETRSPEDTDWTLVPGSEQKDTIYPIHQSGEYLYRAYVQNGVCAPIYSSNYTSYNLLPAPSASAGDNLSLAKGKSAELGANGGARYEWDWDMTLSDTSIANPMVNPEVTTTYYVTITNEHGCTLYDSVLVEVYEDNELYIPNTFTPNNDGANDTWVIRALDQYPDASMEIYNRWGMLLYRQTGGVTPWNGTANGKELPTGTYFYVLKLSPDSETLSGSVSIVR